MRTKRDLKKFLMERLEVYRVQKNAYDAKGESSRSAYIAGNIDMIEEVLEEYLRYIDTSGTEPDTIFKICLREYRMFVAKNFDGIEALVDNTDCIALRKIIKYLRSISHKDEDVIVLWQKILSEWPKFPARISNYSRIRQIHRNLQDIVTILIRRKKNAPEQKRQEDLDQFKRIAKEYISGR